MGNVGYKQELLALLLEVGLKSRALLRFVAPANVEPGGGFALVPEPILELAKVRAVLMGLGRGRHAGDVYGEALRVNTRL